MPVKNKSPSKKTPQPFFETTTAIPSEGYDYENLNKIRRNMIPSTLRGSKIIIAFTRNNRCTNFFFPRGESVLISNSFTLQCGHYLQVTAKFHTIYNYL